MLMANPFDTISSRFSGATTQPAQSNNTQSFDTNVGNRFGTTFTSTSPDYSTDVNNYINKQKELNNQSFGRFTGNTLSSAIDPTIIQKLFQSGVLTSSDTQPLNIDYTKADPRTSQTAYISQYHNTNSPWQNQSIKDAIS